MFANSVKRRMASLLNFFYLGFVCNRDNVKIALADNGYTWTEVTTTSAKAFLTSSSNNNNVIDFTVTVK